MRKSVNCKITRITRLRSAFTLIELLIVVSIILILMTFTAAAVNFALEGEKVSSATGQIQSYLEGARSRAIKAGEPRGVRFYLDPNLSGSVATGVVTTMVYIAPGETWTEGNVRLERTAANPTLATIIAGSPDSGWWELKKRGLLFNNLRVRIPNSRSGSWYSINVDAIDTTGSSPPSFTPSNPFPLKITITPPFRDPATNSANSVIAFAGGGPSTYRIELAPSVLPRAPVLLPKGTVLDLVSSRYPGLSVVGLTSTVTSPLPYFDIMFTPRGTVMGSAAATGLTHLYVTELAGAELLRDWATEVGSASSPPVVLGSGSQLVPADQFYDTAGALWPDGDTTIGDRRIVSIYSQTGSISTHSVDPTDALDPTDLDGDNNFNEPDGFADDPYFYAESAEEAN